MKKMILGSAIMLLTVTLFAQPQQHDGPPKPPLIAERWTHDSARLQLYVVLSAMQISNVKAAYTAFYTSMDALMQSNVGMPPVKEEVDKINKAKEEALQEIFTPEQKTRYHAFRKELMPPSPPHGPEHKAPPINS